jgi:hypothetical protein
MISISKFFPKIKKPYFNPSQDLDFPIGGKVAHVLFFSFLGVLTLTKRGLRGKALEALADRRALGEGRPEEEGEISSSPVTLT